MLVYTYYVPGEDLPFYVGKGSPNRPYEHLRPGIRLKGQSHFYHKLNKLIDIDNIYPCIDVVASGLTNQQACELEIKLIKIYGRLDLNTGCLCNHTNGGEGAGTGNCNRLLSEVSIDTRIKQSKPMSAANKIKLSLVAQTRRGTPVESYKLDTGVTIKQYPSICAARRDGYTDAGIRNFINGRSSHHGYYGWRHCKAGA